MGSGGEEVDGKRRENAGKRRENKKIEGGINAGSSKENEKEERIEREEKTGEKGKEKDAEDVDYLAELTLKVSQEMSFLPCHWQSAFTPGHVISLAGRCVNDISLVRYGFVPQRDDESEAQRDFPPCQSHSTGFSTPPDPSSIPIRPLGHLLVFYFLSSL
ncbi:hypothetical protein KUCAC02_016355 [Chaenocephalus aceratus]|uniref:Uncharacterized protein n=1 Tax=Chaenocephalus aceratus TaxID=36190 RepID=A0ACB9Y2A9_CHAAC|nr:hypothetical protein KUCAC02_016355 [Chaenocephalus aceratus]